MPPQKESHAGRALRAVLRGSNFRSVVLVLVTASCAGPITEIVLVVDTDIEGAGELRVVVLHPDGDRADSTADLRTQAGPRTLVLLHRGGALAPVRLTIEAAAAGATLVSVAREVSFEAGRSRRIVVHLADACRAATCAPRETCGNSGECRSPLVTECEYDPSRCADASTAP